MTGHWFEVLFALLIWGATLWLLLNWLPLRTLTGRLIVLSVNTYGLWLIDDEKWLALPVLIILLSNLRLFAARYGTNRERRVLQRTLIRTFFLGLGLYTAWGLAEPLKNAVSFEILGSMLFLLLGLRALVLTYFRSSSIRTPSYSPALKGRPTLTLAIPARNETHALTDSLRAASASDYEKLEILVLDDCSYDSTPQIIRSFAHDGVRFIQGREPAASWLGKNQALETLLTESSGDYILFAGVDIRLQPGSISKLLGMALTANANVLSVQPFRRHFDLVPSLIRPLRSYWQLAFAKWPFMSSCWLVKRDWLIAQGGFRPVRHAVLPERTIASLARRSDSYKFVVSTIELGVSTRKRVGSLAETAVRTLYPLAGRELAWIWLKIFALLLVVALPFSVQSQNALLLVALGWLALIISFIVAELVLQPTKWWLSSFFFLSNLVSELLLSAYSLFSYEFGHVNWKGRNVCLPVLSGPPRERSGIQRGASTEHSE